jgi:hypothetical protein
VLLARREAALSGPAVPFVGNTVGELCRLLLACLLHPTMGTNAWQRPPAPARQKLPEVQPEPAMSEVS